MTLLAEKIVTRKRKPTKRMLFLEVESGDLELRATRLEIKGEAALSLTGV